MVGSGDIIMKPQFLLSWELKLRERKRRSKRKREAGLIGQHFLVY